MTTTEQKKEYFSSQHTVGIEIIKEDLNEKFSGLLKLEQLTPFLGKNLIEKLTDSGKQLLSTGLNTDALNATGTEMRKEFRKHYDEALKIGELALSQGNDPKVAAQKAQARFKQSLAQAQAEETLFQFFLKRLADQGQIFTKEDEPHLREAFRQFMDKTVEKHSDSLKDFQSLESVKARIQLNDESSKSNSNASMTAQVLTKNLNTGPKVDPKVDYKIDIDNLRKQLKHALANLKPGEKINIGILLPNRGDIAKRIAETGFQYKASLLGLLLLLFLQLRMIKKDDTTRALKAVKDLAEKDGLRIDPRDINLKLSVIGDRGNNQTLLEGPLAEPLVQELNKSIAKINPQVSPKFVPSKRKTTEEEDKENREIDRETLRPLTPGIHLQR
ncbi:MAG: hypothetical protein V4471_01505 [Pseudomonadota bacterium]